MASMKEIKRRRTSIQSTEQITKAMKLVSTVKLQKARVKAEKSKPYFSLMYETISNILSKTQNINHKYINPKKGKKAIIAISSNRGLAGGYNNNIIKLITSNFQKEDTVIYAIGKKAKDGLEKKSYKIVADYSEVINEPLYQDAKDISRELLLAFEKGEISDIYIAYTQFKNTLVHIPTLLHLLPIKQNEVKENFEETTGLEKIKESKAIMDYSPNEEEVLDAIVPKYMASIIFGALGQALASENGARMNAMDNATNNARELIDKLGLLYNRARQGAITQELTEIVAGANAIE